MKLSLLTLAAATALVAIVPAAYARNVVVVEDRGSMIDSHGIGDVVNDPVIHPSDAVKDAVNDAVLGDDDNGGNVGDGGTIAEGGGIGVRVDASFGRGQVVLKCVVAGTPSEFPDDLRVRNAGLVGLPGGTLIRWKLGAYHGTAELANTLKPGKSIGLRNVLPDGYEAGTACSAKAIGL